jgi:hypothetical protein
MKGMTRNALTFLWDVGYSSLVGVAGWLDKAGVDACEGGERPSLCEGW